MKSNEYLIAKISVDTAENGPVKFEIKRRVSRLQIKSSGDESNNNFVAT